MNSFLFEIGCEEIPARFVRVAAEQLASKTEAWFEARHITIGSIRAFATPRRLAVYIKDVAESQANQVEVVRGPAAKIAKAEDGAWSKAAEGFARKNRVNLDTLELREDKGTAYVYAIKHSIGVKTEQVLRESFVEVINGLTFPKTMRWEESKIRFIRPVRWLVCLYGDTVIPFTFTRITANRYSRGHRFLGDEVAISHADQYQAELKAQAVIVDMDERQQSILAQIKELETINNWRIPVDSDLLEEVTQLVEFPTILSGRFASDYLKLPKEVLITTMREHQRYFPVESEAGELLPHFVTIRNGDSRSLHIVSQGNEKVLRARLADAEFFFQEDKKQTIDQAMQKLGQIVYQEELGSMADRVARIKHLAMAIAEEAKLTHQEKRVLERAATIAKFDQATNMIGEFPELEGYMGREYALLHGESQEVAEALYEQILPRNPDDELPQSPIGTVLAMADRLDSLTSGFGIGLTASGSQDPYGFRKKAAAVVQLLLQNPHWYLSITKLIDLAVQVVELNGRLKRLKAEVSEELMEFFHLRLKALLTEQKIRYDVIDAVLAGDLSNLSLMIEKANVLMECVYRDDFKLEVEGFTRVSNLAAKADGRPINEAFLRTTEEIALYEGWKHALVKFQQATNATAMYQALANLVPAIHTFFDHVMVMVEDENIKANRLALLREIHLLTDSYAAFNQLVFAKE